MSLVSQFQEKTHSENASAYCLTNEELSKTDGRSTFVIYFKKIRPGDYLFSGDFVGELQAKLDTKDKELESLRGFSKMALTRMNIDSEKLSVLAKQFGLADENGNPTRLLSGEVE